EVVQNNAVRRKRKNIDRRRGSLRCLGLGTAGWETVTFFMRQPAGQVTRRYQVAIFENHHPLDDVTQLPDVARPAITAEDSSNFGRQTSNALSQTLVEIAHVVFGQQDTIVTTISQRRNIDLDHR